MSRKISSAPAPQTATAVAAGFDAGQDGDDQRGQREAGQDQQRVVVLVGCRLNDLQRWAGPVQLEGVHELRSGQQRNAAERRPGQQELGSESAHAPPPATDGARRGGGLGLRTGAAALRPAFAAG